MLFKAPADALLVLQKWDDIWQLYVHPAPRRVQVTFVATLTSAEIPKSCHF